jgi:hypothetical protein
MGLGCCTSSDLADKPYATSLWVGCDTGECFDRGLFTDNMAAASVIQ